ncbi:AAWKG family protein [Streptomyces humidus]|uniref:AAWKG family protein n=1 Tax=Streptomyces humidus TaxID=52259 RepID=UPI003321FC20
MADSTSVDDDYWSRAVSLFTGYPLPNRNELFEKLKSDKDVPLFRHGIETLPVRQVHPGEYGRNVRSGEDYDVVFYTSSGGDGAHGGVKMRRVRIVLIGVLADANGRATFFGENKDPLGDQWSDNNTFTGIGGKQWDASAMAQYIFGGRRALGALTGQHSTKDFTYAGQSVADSSAVDLRSFTRTAQSFDRTKDFFVRQAATLEQWNKALGSEQAAWRGKAAGVFRGLIEQLHKNYDGYADQLGGRDYQGAHLTVDGYRPTSRPGHAVTVAQRNLLAQAKVLERAWQDWADSDWHDPHRVVVTLLDDLVGWLITNNLTKVLMTAGGTGPQHSLLPPIFHTGAGFHQVHPVYGDLNKDEAWKKLGETAVRKWREWQDFYVEKDARNALAHLSNQWLDAAKAVGVPLRTRSTETPTERFQKEEARLAKEKAAKEGDSLSKTLNSLGDFGKQLNKSMDDFSRDMGKGLGGFSQELNKGLNDFGQGMNKGLNDFGQGMNKGLEDVTKGIGDNVSGLNEGLKGFGNSLGDVFGGGGDGRGDAADGGRPPVTSPLNDLLPGLGTDTSDGSTGDAVRNPDGSTTTRSPDGTLTTTYPDGTVTAFNPSTGLMTTTSANGKISTTELGQGKPVTNPDGSTTVLNPDGSLTTKYPDGSVQTIRPDGTVTTTDPDGSVHSSQLNPSPGTVTTPSGSTTKLNPDGTLTTTFPDGTKETVDPSAGTVTTTSPDGTKHTDSLAPGKTFTNPDGSTTALNPDGSLTTKYPDGSVQTIRPDGTVTTTDPDGKVTTTDLDGSSAGTDAPGKGGASGGGTSGLNDGLPAPSSSGPDKQGHDYGDDHDFDTSGLDFGGLAATPLNPDLAGLGGAGAGAAGEAGQDSYEEYDSTPYDGGALRAPTGDAAGSPGDSAAGQGATGGMPLNPMAFGGMGGMGGMPGMGGGGGGGGGSNGERVRSVLGDGDGAALRRRPRTRGAAAADDEENVVVTRGGRPVTTSTPYAPVGAAGGQGGRSTESGDRVRSNWGTDEDDDVWGTDEGGAPAVIGR